MSLTVNRRDHAIALVVFAMWFGVVLTAAWNHVVWRDEVRALSLALQGNNVFAMLKGIHGEGHPALWYLLLRVAHALVAKPEVLKIAALVVAFVAALLLVLRSPFRWPLIAVLLAGNILLFEYSIMARNYGISMLLLFLIAIVYERHRSRGFILGTLLLLLANCNAHSALLVGAFLLFWWIDTTTDNRGDRSQALKAVYLNAAIAVLGVAVCMLTILSPVNDAALSERPHGISFELLLNAIFLPANQFQHISGMRAPWVLEHLLRAKVLCSIFQVLLSFIMFGSTLGLVRWPGACLASVTALIGFSTFFAYIYPGSYRHEALWIVFLISMYWITTAKARRREQGLTVRLHPVVRSVSNIGWLLFVLLLVLQVPIGIMKTYLTVYGPPLSRSHDFGALVQRRPDLKDAIITAEPDYLLETLPYYIPNRTYLIREERFGSVVAFSGTVRSRLSLDDVLVAARNLHTELGKPVVILLAARLDAALPAQVYAEVYNWSLVTTAEEVRVFQASTRLIERFAPAGSDESYDVYILDH